MGFCDTAGTCVGKGSDRSVTPRETEVPCGPIWPQFILRQFGDVEKEEEISASGTFTRRAPGAQAVY